MNPEFLKEKEPFLNWFKNKYASIERGQSMFGDILRIRDAGIPEEELLHDDERNVCDRYFVAIGRTDRPSRNTLKQYRQAVRLYRDFRESVI